MTALIAHAPDEFKFGPYRLSESQRVDTKPTRSATPDFEIGIGEGWGFVQKDKGEQS